MNYTNDKTLETVYMIELNKRNKAYAILLMRFLRFQKRIK